MIYLQVNTIGVLVIIVCFSLTCYVILCKQSWHTTWVIFLSGTGLFADGTLGHQSDIITLLALIQDHHTTLLSSGTWTFQSEWLIKFVLGRVLKIRSN